MKKKKSKILILQSIIPWFILICGIPAVICFAIEDFTKLEVFHQLAMITGLSSIIIELVIGIVFFISIIVSAVTKKNGKYSIVNKIGIWVYSIVCIAGTLLLMLLLQGFTYGQGV